MPDNSQSRNRYQERLRSVIKRAAVIFAVLTLVATSGFFIVNAYQAERFHVRGEAARAADLIAARVREDPAEWQHDVPWLDETINNLHGPGEESWHEIVNLSGDVITRSGEVAGPLSVVGEAPIRAGGETLAIVRIGQVPHLALGFTGLGLGLGLVLSACVIVVLWVLPMRALDVAFRRTNRYREALERRVGELEQTQQALQRQGAELTQIAERLFDARETERKANAAKSEFLANMSHELRTPLNTIIGFTEVMQLESFGPIANARYAEYLEHIHDSGNLLLGLINDMLDLAKVESGKLDLDERPVAFDVVVDECRTLLEQRIGSGGLTFAVNMQQGLPKVIADERKIQQILLNLLSNAIKHTPRKGRVTVEAWWDAPGPFAFTVADTGVGMAPEDIPKALEPFGQVGDPMISSEKGTGLGLPLTKALVELHGGTITLESELGRGTTATVMLPAERVLGAGESFGTESYG
jgi:signal transduction histidine kinase